MKKELKKLFKEFNDCMNIEDIIISEKNITFTFKRYISTSNIEKLVNVLEIEHYIIQVHNYQKMEIVFTYNSTFDKN